MKSLRTLASLSTTIVLFTACENARPPAEQESRQQPQQAAEPPTVTAEPASEEVERPTVDIEPQVQVAVDHFIKWSLKVAASRNAAAHHTTSVDCVEGLCASEYNPLSTETSFYYAINWSEEHPVVFMTRQSVRGFTPTCDVVDGEETAKLDGPDDCSVICKGKGKAKGLEFLVHTVWMSEPTTFVHVYRPSYPAHDANFAESLRGKQGS